MKVENQQLKCVLYIQYPIKFKKSNIEVQALMDSGSEINAMTPAYTVVFGLFVYFTDIEI